MADQIVAYRVRAHGLSLLVDSAFTTGCAREEDENIHQTIPKKPTCPLKSFISLRRDGVDILEGRY